MKVLDKTIGNIRLEFKANTDKITYDKWTNTMHESTTKFKTVFSNNNDLFYKAAVNYQNTLSNIIKDISMVNETTCGYKNKSTNKCSCSNKIDESIKINDQKRKIEINTNEIIAEITQKKSKYGSKSISGSKAESELEAKDLDALIDMTD